MHTTVWSAAGLVLAWGLAGSGCERSSTPPPGAAGLEIADFGEVPPFELVDQEGRPFTRPDLEGRIWVVDFVFTNCAGPCPRMTAELAALSRRLADTPQVRFLTVTVDPANDAPAVLKAYGERHGADFRRWVFATGEKAAIYALSIDGFHLGMGDPGAEDPLLHSTRFVVVDERGRIRAYHDTQAAGEDPQEAVLATVRQLQLEAAGRAAAAPGS